MEEKAETKDGTTEHNRNGIRGSMFSVRPNAVNEGYRLITGVIQRKLIVYIHRIKDLVKGI